MSDFPPSYKATLKCKLQCCVLNECISTTATHTHVAMPM